MLQYAALLRLKLYNVNNQSLSANLPAFITILHTLKTDFKKDKKL